jgi:hypothetical protein
MNLNVKRRLFLVLFLAGFAGVVTILLLDFGAVAALLPMPAESLPRITPAIKLLSLVQPAVLLAIAVLIGVVLAPKVGLSAPVAESIAAAAVSRVASALRPQLLPGVLGSLVGAASVILSAAVLKPFISAEILARISQFTGLLPLPMRFLYGGITEELLLRWGFMTLLVWVAWRLFQKGRVKPSAKWFVVAILVSAFVFALGHLPVAIMLLGKPTAAIVLFVIVANSAFGVVAGYLYWKYGLESAMIAHLLGHVVLALASYAGAYF